MAQYPRFSKMEWLVPPPDEDVESRPDFVEADGYSLKIERIWLIEDKYSDAQQPRYSVYIHVLLNASFATQDDDNESEIGNGTLAFDGIDASGVGGDIRYSPPYVRVTKTRNMDQQERNLVDNKRAEAEVARREELEVWMGNGELEDHGYTVQDYYSGNLGSEFYHRNKREYTVSTTMDIVPSEVCASKVISVAEWAIRALIAKYGPDKRLDNDRVGKVSTAFGDDLDELPF